ncbi:hypothetical protein BFG57_11185 [Bacillus solimangrovi]|uniref:Major facilitator superfamily (MFS) profile domain-containing protein n=2 Tax=Bacillus solimangrovi TaxID=1305675 RepID=A0A1E5LI91_9BACI|nr:hypothetical protein BFG57_11185 [Bacillus solimangrovi]
MYDQFGENIILTTLVIGVQPFTEIVLTFSIGKWIDRFGRRPILLWSLLIQVIAIAGFALASHVWLFVLCAFLNGLGRFAYIPISRAQISDTVHPEKQAETFALLSTASSIGSLGGPIVGAILFQLNPQVLFIVMAVLLVLYFIMALKFLPESNPITNTNEPVYKLRANDYKMIVWLVVGMLPISFFHSQMETNWPLYLKEYMVNYLFVFSLLETIGTVIFIVLEVVLVNRTSKYSRFRIIQAGYFLYAFASLGFGFSNHIVGLIVSQVLLCLGAIVILNHMQVIISTLAPKEHKGRYFALFGLHWDISRSTGPLLGGSILALVGGKGLFLITFLLLILGVISQTKAIQSIDRKTNVVIESRSALVEE